MRQIGTLPEGLDARGLVDYLLSLGIKTRLDPSPAGQTIWVINEDYVDRARKELAEYVAQPRAPRFVEAARAADEVRSREARLDRQYRKNYREIAASWGSTPARRRPVTLALVCISILVFALGEMTPPSRDRSLPPDISPLENALLFSPIRLDLNMGKYVDCGTDAILRGEAWRLITPIFLHFNLLHIAFNCWATVIEGTIIETRRGILRMAILVLISAIVSNMGQYFYTQRMAPGELHIFGGLSGVGYALFGYLWMKGQYEPEQGMILHPNTISTMLMWLVLCMTGMLGPIANAAHVVGLLVGIAFGVLRY